MISVRERAMNFLSYREHSRYELHCKLARHDYNPEDIEQALQLLQEENLQCDVRFAESYVTSKSESGYGPRYITQQLQQRRVNASVIADAIQAVYSWQAIIERIWHKKYNVSMTSVKDQAKQRRYLLSRGFEPEHVSDWMKNGIPTSIDKEY